mmetsp:Transcript_120250/g.256648  ORF Transcript_120250/g.256648 Transcript_120250/m.256648 type:complete len:287 (-) Transcript_120250:475-1335(-)
MGEKRRSTETKPLTRICTESSPARMPSTPCCAPNLSERAPAAPRINGGNQRSCLIWGRPSRKRTISASAQPEIAVPLPTEPPFTAWWTFRKAASEMTSTTSVRVCITFEWKERPQILLCKSKYCWLSADSSAPNSGFSCCVRPGGKSTTASGAAVLAACTCACLGARVGGAAERRETWLRPLTTKSSFSLARNSPGFMPMILDKLTLNFCTNLAHKSLTSMVPEALVFRICSSSAATLKGFNAVSWRTNATLLFSSWNCFCFLTKSCSFSSLPRVLSACVMLTPCL